MRNPYAGLGSRAFWRKAVAEKSMFSISDLWTPKFTITNESAVSTYGSCFAQHIGRSLRAKGYSWLIAEVPPDGLSEKASTELGYGIFSSRTANIYTASLLNQWLQWASGKSLTPKEIWEENGRYYDPFRPAIESNGFKSEREVLELREYTVAKFRESIEKAEFLVFTMGLTESWFNIAGYEYPMCPGTIAGSFDSSVHQFLNQDYSFVLERMISSLDLAKSLNPNLKFILTVSPVPLTATNSGEHVLVATMRSKSTLRAVAAQLAETREDVDYFPSYEIINSPAFAGAFFEPNKRSVHPAGVEFVMRAFFSGLVDPSMKELKRNKASALILYPDNRGHSDQDSGCEEAMLEIYSGQNK